jgi:hypothetical protein
VPPDRAGLRRLPDRRELSQRWPHDHAVLTTPAGSYAGCETAR